MSPTASPHFVELDPMHGGCPNEWNNYEDYEAEDLVAVVVSGGCESPTTPKPTKSPLKLTPKPTNQFCFDTPAPSASPITPAPSKSPITPQPSASPSKNVRYYMFSLCLVNDRGGLTHIYIFPCLLLTFVSVSLQGVRLRLPLHRLLQSLL